MDISHPVPKHWVYVAAVRIVIHSLIAHPSLCTFLYRMFFAPAAQLLANTWGRCRLFEVAAPPSDKPTGRMCLPFREPSTFQHDNHGSLSFETSVVRRPAVMPDKTFVRCVALRWTRVTWVRLLPPRKASSENSGSFTSRVLDCVFAINWINMLRIRWTLRQTAFKIGFGVLLLAIVLSVIAFIAPAWQNTGGLWIYRSLESPTPGTSSSSFSQWSYSVIVFRHFYSGFSWALHALSVSSSTKL